MTINTAIEKVDSLRPSAYSLEEKTAWVIEVEIGSFTKLTKTFGSGIYIPSQFLTYP